MIFHVPFLTASLNWLLHSQAKIRTRHLTKRNWVVFGRAKNSEDKINLRMVKMSNFIFILLDWTH